MRITFFIIVCIVAQAQYNVDIVEGLSKANVSYLIMIPLIQDIAEIYKNFFK